MEGAFFCFGIRGGRPARDYRCLKHFMADINDTAAQAEQSTPSVEGNESTEVEEIKSQDQEENQPGAESENQSEDEKSSGEAGDQSEQSEKPTRAERRIQSLLSKVKENGERQNQTPPQYERRQPLISEEERQSGEIDPDILNQRIQSTIQNEVQRAIQMDRAKGQFESSVKEHQADLESIKDIDPDLEAEATAEYEALNYRLNPFTGKSQFIPAVKFSEIVAKIEARAEKLAAKRAEAIAEGNERYIKNVSSSQAVPASGSIQSSKSIKPETTDFSEFEKAFSKK